MDIFEEIADERRVMADLLAGLTAEQLAAPSLCSEWSVREVAAHLIVPLEVSMPRFMLTIAVCRGNFDRANARLARQQAQRPFAEIIDVLRRKAEPRFTPPRAGAEAPLTDILVHGLDIRWPLQISRQVPEERLRTSLVYLTSGVGKAAIPPSTVSGLRLEVPDLDWAHGDGPSVSGPADALLLTLTGRTAALDHLTGQGLAVLRERLTSF